MADQDLFDENKGKDNGEGEPTSNPTPNTDGDGETIDQLLASIVNENGEQKYSKPEEALKGAAHAQEHIKNLERELAELKDKGNASDKLDELLETVKSSQASGQGEEASTMKPEDVLTIVKDYFSDAKAAETRENNISTVTKVFRDRYGKEASENLYGKAEDLGLGKEEINRMIANNPKAALKILGEDIPKGKSGKDPVVSGGSIDTSQFQGTPPRQPKSVMGPTKTGELNDAWEASKKRTLERLGLSES